MHKWEVEFIFIQLWKVGAFEDPRVLLVMQLTANAAADTCKNGGFCHTEDVSHRDAVDCFPPIFSGHKNTRCSCTSFVVQVCKEQKENQQKKIRDIVYVRLQQCVRSSYMIRHDELSFLPLTDTDCVFWDVKESSRLAGRSANSSFLEHIWSITFTDIIHVIFSHILPHGRWERKRTNKKHQSKHLFRAVFLSPCLSL